jgi:molybdate transport system substrate-binding protein
VVAAEGLVKGDPTIFAQNELVLIVPADNPANIQNLADIAQPDVKIVTATVGVPIRDYTDILLDNLTEDATYGDEFYAGFYDNLRSEETNVRQVVLKTALGEADAAIVYRTDITSEVAEQLQVIPIPQEFAPQPVYFIAVIKSGDSTKVAEDFIAYIMSDAGQAILRDYGFVEATVPSASNE